MNERSLKKNSETDWARIDQMTDDDIDTSDIPPLDDEFFERAIRDLPRVYLDRIDLTEAQRLAEYILAEGWSEQKDSLEHDAFNTALVIAYGRPFCTGYDLERQREPRLDQQIEILEFLNGEELSLHKRVMKSRDEVYAHTDARSSLFEGLDYYDKRVCLVKAELNLNRSEVELLKKIIEKWLDTLTKIVARAKDR